MSSYVIINGQKAGPFSIEQLQSLARAGVIATDTFFISSEDLEKVTEFFRQAKAEYNAKNAPRESQFWPRLKWAWEHYAGLFVLGTIATFVVVALVAHQFSNDIEGTTWYGSEDLPGFGSLKFEFNSKQRAVMNDARGTVHGNWKQEGSSVTITFANCTYHGTISGKTIRGTAYYTRPQIANWGFAVSR